MKYSPTDDFSGTCRSVETSAEACKARCEADPSFPLFGKANETFSYVAGPSSCSGEEDIFRVKATVQLGYHYFLILRSCPSTRCSRCSSSKHILRLHAL